MSKDHDFYTALGARLRDARIAKGLSQGALGETVGVSFQQVQKYEKGHDRVPVDKLVAMAAALESPLLDLIAGGAAVVHLATAEIRERNRAAEAVMRLDPAIRRRLMALVDVLPAAAEPVPAEAPAAPEAAEPLAA